MGKSVNVTSAPEDGDDMEPVVCGFHHPGDGRGSSSPGPMCQQQASALACFDVLRGRAVVMEVLVFRCGADETLRRGEGTPGLDPSMVLRRQGGTQRPRPGSLPGRARPSLVESDHRILSLVLGTCRAKLDFAQLAACGRSPIAVGSVSGVIMRNDYLATHGSV